MIVKAVRADGSIREMVVENGARLILGPEERLIVVADPDQARMTSQPDGLTTIALKGFGEFSVQVAGDIPLEPAEGPVVSKPATAGAPRPVIIFETMDPQSENGSVTMEPLGIHEASLGDAGFVDQQVDASLGMGETVELAAYDADEVGVTSPAFIGGDARDRPGELVSQDARGQDFSQPHPSVITGHVTGAVTEDAGVVAGNIPATGKLTAMDPDPGESGFTAGAVPGAYGELSIDADGNWTYTADNSQSAIQSLGAGETLSESFTVTTLDGTPQNIDITINGTGDVAVIGGDDTGAVTEDVAVVSGNLTDSGTLTITDLDSGEDSFDTGSVVYTGAGTQLGTLSITAAGVWTYTVANADVQYLGAGDTKVETFTVQSLDGTPHTITVTINGINEDSNGGTNDGAVIGGDDTGAVTEDVAVVSGNLTDSGTLTITDADSGEASFDTCSVVDTMAGGALGSLSINAAGVWTYTVANADVQYLGAGDTKVETFTVASIDGTTKTITVTISGTNDGAVIGGVDVGSVTEDAANPNLTSTGTLTITDADSGEASFNTTSVVYTGGTQLGTLSITAAGVWTYTVANADVQYLGAGDTKIETFTVQSLDGTTHTITVTINGTNEDSNGGTNDGAVIGGVDVGSVTEDASPVTLTSTGTLTITDVDSGEASFNTTSVVYTGGGTQLGTLSITAAGVWTYTVANASVQYLGAGITKVETFTVASLDGTTKTITVTISGTNDGPVITGDLLGDVTDTVEYTVTNTDLNATDANGDALTYTVTALPTRGVLKLNGNPLAVNDTFTQSDISSGFLTFAFSVIAGVAVQSFKTDSFDFTVSDGTASESGTFTFENSATIVIGTGGADDLTSYVTDASETYHVYGMGGDDTLAGNAGSDTLDGGLGSDTADYSAAVASVTVDLSGPTDTAVSVGTDTLVGIENALGSDHDDVFIGDENNNTFMGGAGNDSLSGFGGNDSLFGGAGMDTLDGGDGDDTLEGGAGADSLVGGEGTDTASYSASAAGVVVNLGTGVGSGGDAQGDTLLGIENLVGSAYNDSLTGKFGANNHLSGGAGNDSLDGSLGADTLDGGDGIDAVYYNIGTAGAVNVNLETGMGSGGHAQGDRYVSIENVLGSGGNDTLIGDANANLLRGLTGNDSIDGGGGDDTLEGGAGADYLVGGAGIDTATYRISSTGTGVNVSLVPGVVGIGGDAQGDTLMGIENLAGTNFADTLAGDEGANVLDGGAGSDTVSYSASNAGVNVNLVTGAVSGGHATGDTLVSIENLIGSAHGDTLIGSGENNVLEGGAGADYLDGGGGADTASYSASSVGVNVNLATGVGLGGDAQGDTLIGIENLFGSASDDILSGNSLANVLDGGAGNDTLHGGTGLDTLLGGAGDDFLRFSLDTPGLLDGLNTVQESMVGLLDGGSGTDSLALDGHAGTGAILDLSPLMGAGKLTGMEKIDITGDANDQNTLRLSASDVLDMSDTDILRVDGDAGDTVVSSSGWINNGVVTLDGHTYNDYSATVGADTVHLYVDVDILDQTIT